VDVVANATVLRYGPFCYNLRTLYKYIIGKELENTHRVAVDGEANGHSMI
jgi:hypothetical protein